MQVDPRYDDVVAEIVTYLRGVAVRATNAGVSPLWLDPGIGFGKTTAHNVSCSRTWTSSWTSRTSSAPVY